MLLQERSAHARSARMRVTFLQRRVSSSNCKPLVFGNDKPFVFDHESSRLLERDSIYLINLTANAADNSNSKNIKNQHN